MKKQQRYYFNKLEIKMLSPFLGGEDRMLEHFLDMCYENEIGFKTIYKPSDLCDAYITGTEEDFIILKDLTLDRYKEFNSKGLV